MASERTTPTPPEAGPLSPLQDELRLVEVEIEQLRRAAEEIRSRIGERAEGATDLGDRSAATAQAEKVPERIRAFSGTRR